MDFPTLLPVVAPNTTLVAAGLGQWSSVVTAGITGAVALTSLYFQQRNLSDAATRERHERERAAAREAERQAAIQAQLAAQAQTAAVQTVTGGAQAASAGAPMGLAAGLGGAPVLLIGGVAVAVVLAVMLGGRR